MGNPCHRWAVFGVAFLLGAAIASSASGQAPETIDDSADSASGNYNPFTRAGGVKTGINLNFAGEDSGCNSTQILLKAITASGVDLFNTYGGVKLSNYSKTLNVLNCDQVRKRFSDTGYSIGGYGIDSLCTDSKMRDEVRCYVNSGPSAQGSALCLVEPSAIRTTEKGSDGRNHDRVRARFTGLFVVRKTSSPLHSADRPIWEAWKMDRDGCKASAFGEENPFMSSGTLLSHDVCLDNLRTLAGGKNDRLGDVYNRLGVCLGTSGATCAEAVAKRVLTCIEAFPGVQKEADAPVTTAPETVPGTASRAH